MAEPTNLIVGSVLIDDVVYADQSERKGVLGGAGLYALAGAALFSESAILVAGAGEDVSDTFGPWMQRNRLTGKGLRIADSHTPRNILRYIDEHTRTETPLFGHEHFKRLEPTADDLRRVIDGARGVYLFRNTEPEIWTGVRDLRQRYGFKLLWEIALDACSPHERPRIEAVLASVDAFSLNVDEASLIFGTANEERLIAMLQALPVAVVFLRAGRRGSFAITPTDVRFLPSLDVGPIDVTGGGNAYCGAALVGFAEGKPPYVAGMMGTVAASIAIGQYGPPEAGDAEVRARARTALSELVPLIEQGAN